MSETTLAAPYVTLPPTQAELPCDDGIPMETQRHKYQMDLLIETLEFWLAQREDGFVSGNMFVYYSMAQVRNKDFKGPDFFVVLGVPKGERRSWVVWEEGKAPDLVIELLSESTAEADKNEKKLIYQNQMRVPEYFWFDPFNPDDWAGFSIQQGVYQPLVPNERNQLVSQSLGLGLQRWQGKYRGVDTVWLRWATMEGEVLPTGMEIAQQEHQLAEQERQRAEQEYQRAEQERQRTEQVRSQLQQTVRNLLQAGMTVEQVAKLTGLDVSQVQELGN
ncbi:Uma2 family endonuclease [Brasilonema bromeliae]|uniref:Uma2 family endonuclease n=1 Tax=Brasilonema bromeliae SPC951 TaxID=385972 RepID=A0ABX1P334_9CYAN|nr:Uma2 family endonuclease [Brasilonema bromeliae]NMG18292.1 Uma2 family endonuclease [Brasilonema bromeliae SPC951]